MTGFWIGTTIALSTITWIVYEMYRAPLREDLGRVDQELDELHRKVKTGDASGAPADSTNGEVGGGSPVWALDDDWRWHTPQDTVWPEVTDPYEQQMERYTW